jgi:hypothetical protein
MRSRPVKAAILTAASWLLSAPAFAQHDPGVRGGVQNTAGMLQYSGIPTTGTAPEAMISASTCPGPTEGS